MLRSIVVGRQKPVGRAMFAVYSNRIRALRAKPGARQAQVPTIGTGSRERSCAVLAEFRFGPIVVLTLRALHLRDQTLRCDPNHHLTLIATAQQPDKGGLAYRGGPSHLS